MMMKSLLATLLCAAALPAAAHDFWIEPSSFHPAAGATFTASLRVGQDFLGDPVPRNSALIERFVVRDGDGERPVVGPERQDPAGYARVDRAGTALIAYRSKPSPVELPAQKFEAYLKDEGLESIIALRAKRGDGAKPGKEIFSRCAKTLVVADGGAPADYDKPFGLRLELIPESLGTTTTRYRLLFEGKPLAGALVSAIAQDGVTPRRSARTDARGRVEFALPKGVWLIKSTHMIAAPPDSGAEWESLWASLTFER
jgi:uncharacterized GH25 family protein